MWKYKSVWIEWVEIFLSLIHRLLKVLFMIIEKHQDFTYSEEQLGKIDF